jgi:hypothetical protein
MFTHIIYKVGQGEFVENFINNMTIISGFENFVYSLIKNRFYCISERVQI